MQNISKTSNAINIHITFNISIKQVLIMVNIFQLSGREKSNHCSIA